MADITIAGATYPDVPAVDLPISGGGTQRFVDTSDADATVNDLAAGKSAYVNGTRLVGSKKAKIRKITDYLYFFDIDFDLDYDKAIEYAEEHSVVPSACSTIRKGDFLGRNLDWKYAETAEFIVNTKALKGRHASIGVATGLADLTNTFADSGVWSDLYEVLPFGTTDGINDKGVCVEMNAVNGYNNYYAAIDDDNDVTLALAMIPRYVLDYADSAAHAITLLQNVDIVPPFTDLPVDVHFMIADKNDTYVVEFVPDGNGGTEMVYFSLPDADDHLPILTNFYLSQYFDDGTYVGHGTARYDALEDGYDNVETKQDVIDLLASVYATTSNNITLSSRDGTQQHTTHSVVYDIAAKTMTILPQPDVPNPTGEVYSFAVNNDAVNRSSWNDISDKPFYDYSDAAINISNPDFTDASAISFTISLQGDTIPCKALRVSDYIPKNRLEGCSVIVHMGSYGDQEPIELDYSAFIDTSSGYMMAPDGYATLFCSAINNATFSIQDVFSVTLPVSGLYLCYINGAESFLENDYYIKSITKASSVKVKKLDEKYYKSPFWIHGTLDLQNMTVSGFDKTYSDILAAWNNDEIIKMKLTYYTGLTTFEVGVGECSRSFSSGRFAFTVMIYGDLGGGNQLYYLTLYWQPDDSKSVQTVLINSTSI